MITYFFEATNGFNWGKFAVGVFDDEEWERRSQVNRDLEGNGRRLLPGLGWGREPQYLHVWIFDLQTGEAMFGQPLDGGAGYQLNGVHQIKVCPLFPAFLDWLYRHDVSEYAGLAGTVVRLTDEEAPPAFSSHPRGRGERCVPHED